MKRPHKYILVLGVFAWLCGLSQSISCDTCSGHGLCDRETGTCKCFPGYMGATCKSMKCPSGIAWSDYATATDTAHAMAECSNMGLCDRTTGACRCASGFEGVACERMSCPTCVNGRCISMREAAQIQDNTNFFVATTYNQWDADKIYGCQCDNGFFGYDCSLRACPKGDDPMTSGQVNEIQRLTCKCNGCAGTFAITFRRRTTINLLPTNTANDLKDALEKLDTINGVIVSGSSSAICDSSTTGAVSEITFTKNPGNLPLLQVQSRLSGGDHSVAITAVQDGTREEAFCSNRGVCDYSLGVCTCNSGFSSSDGAGNQGNLGDCGYGSTTACPTTSNGICDGKGACSPAPPYACNCNDGFTGVDCTQRTCPNGVAWFDGATTPDTAHAMAPCSNKGLCDTKTGLCTCASIFTGSACEVLKCPASNTCNGHGTCKTMQQLALASASNGDLLGVTYGDTHNNPATWDYNKIQGCDCAYDYYLGPYSGALGGFRDFDCSSRFCPLGADPHQVNKVNEIQSISCAADGGTFTLKFRQQTTAAIAWNANAATVQQALENLSSIFSVKVSFSSGSSVCAATAITTDIEFTYELGDIPPMTFTHSLTLSSSSSPGVVFSIAETRKGTKANAECSGRGLCDRTTGVCKCFDQYLSSDGDGNVGARGDCGYISPYPTIELSK